MALETGRKIGLLGGTFDPVHLAHLHMAEVAKEECGLEEIWFVPAKSPPHKQGQPLTPAEHRLAMLRLAIEEVPYFKLCLVEFEREGPSYTIDTVIALQNRHPFDQFYFIIGEDMAASLDRWERIDQLLMRITFIVLTRPGVTKGDWAPWQERIIHVPMLPSHLSSTLIRKRVQEGKSIRFLVPEKVYAYIAQHRLYSK